jgi:hypothetical protein
MPRTIGLLAIVGGFPLGFALSIANLNRLGRRRAGRVLYGLWGLATLALVAVGLYLPIAGLYLVGLNLASAACFYFLTRNALTRAASSEQNGLSETVFAAIGLGLTAWLLWFLLFSALLAGARYLLALYQIPLP